MSDEKVKEGEALRARLAKTEHVVAAAQHLVRCYEREGNGVGVRAAEDRLIREVRLLNEPSGGSGAAQDGVLQEPEPAGGFQDAISMLCDIVKQSGGTMMLNGVEATAEELRTFAARNAIGRLFGVTDAPPEGSPRRRCDACRGYGILPSEAGEYCHVPCRECRGYGLTPKPEPAGGSARACSKLDPGKTECSKHCPFCFPDGSR